MFSLSGIFFSSLYFIFFLRQRTASRKLLLLFPDFFFAFSKLLQQLRQITWKTLKVLTKPDPTKPNMFDTMRIKKSGSNDEVSY